MLEILSGRPILPKNECYVAHRTIQAQCRVRAIILQTICGTCVSCGSLMLAARFRWRRKSAAGTLPHGVKPSAYRHGLMSRRAGTVIEWRRIPKQALIDALRNTTLGPSNLSRQDKAELVRIAVTGLRSTKADQLRSNLDREMAFRKGTP